jgi:hypothetical protein
MRRRTKRFFRRVLLTIPVLAIAAFLYLLFRGPSAVKAADIRVVSTPDRLERGEYLFTALLACDDCHSERDFSRLGGPAATQGRGKGTVIPLRGLPGTIVASNITPDRETGIGAWTDGEKIRAIREGVGRDGRALYPLMPYQGFRALSDEDAQALVAYLNSLPPVRNALPRSRVSFPASMLIKGAPAPVDHVIPSLDPDDGEVYGDYLATIAGCEGCHTPVNFLGNSIASLSYAGGRLFETPYGLVASANLTQDAETGIGKWEYKRFQELMHSYAQYKQDFPKVGPERFTMMPWISYSRLTDHDVESLFLHLKRVKPVSNRVETHPR